MDTLGRVRTSRERRKVILEEFDQTGVSATHFAKMAGSRYSTFAAWISLRSYRYAWVERAKTCGFPRNSFFG